jgi:hypothetical protein
MMSVSERASSANGESLSLADDLLRGAKEIAEFIYGKEERRAGDNRKRVYLAAARKGLPAFKIGRVIHARKSTLLRWIESLEHNG